MKFKIILLLTLLFSSVLNASTIIGTITNTATAKYNIGSLQVQQVSIPVKINVVKTNEKVEFMKIISDERPTPETVVNSKTEYEPTEKYGFNDMGVVKVTDGDININPYIREEVEVTLNSDNGDIEKLILVETTVNSGVFMGNIGINNETIITNNGLMNVRMEEYIRATYTDEYTKSATAQIVYPEKLKILVNKMVDKNKAAIGDFLKYTISVKNNENFVVEDLRIFDEVPYGIKIKEETFKLNGEKISPITSEDGKIVKKYIPKFAANSEMIMEFIAEIGAGAIDKKIINRAYAANEPYFKSNVSEVETTLTDEFMQNKSLIVGQVFECRYRNNKKDHGVAGVRIFTEDGTYVVTDKRGMYHIEGLDRGTHVLQIDEDVIPYGYKKGRLKDKRNAYQNAESELSQFVEVETAILKRADFCLNKMSPSELRRTKQTKETDLKMEEYEQDFPEFNDKFFKEVGGERKIMWPKENYIPRTLSTSVVATHEKNEKTIVYVNDTEISALNFNGGMFDKKTNTKLSVWKGLPLKNGNNDIKVEVINDKTKKIVQTLNRKVYVSSRLVNIKLVEEKSELVANGKTSPIIAVQMTDSLGYKLRPGLTGTYKVKQPYQPLSYKKEAGGINGGDDIYVEGKFQVYSDGISYIKLKPTTKVDNVELVFSVDGKNKVINTKLSPNLREWIMVGFAEGTVGFNTLESHKEFIDNKNADQYYDGRASFFAKGKIKGEWLMTIRYDSGREKENHDLFQEIDPEAYYMVYNDDSVQGTESPSRDKLYVKVEKKDFYLMYGDIRTGLDVTELAPYKRDVTGLKMKYETKSITSTNIVAETETLFKRDEIRGDGTSGYYYLQGRSIIDNSEKIVIETRDRYRSERIIESVELKRFKDYDVNYINGSLFFNSPISKTDKDFNPKFIVVTYEVEGDGANKYVIAGRSSFRPNEKSVEVGTSYIYEDTEKEKKLLNAVDITVNITDNMELKGEYARSSSDDQNTDEEKAGTAKLLQLEYYKEDKTSLETYVREQSKNYGLGQTTETLNAKRKVGLDAKHELFPSIELETSIFRDSNLEDETDLDVMEAKVKKVSDTYEYFLGYRSSKKTEELLNNQLLIGASKSFLEDTLTFNAEYDYALENTDSTIYPTKTKVGTNYKMTKETDIFATYEWTEREDLVDMGRVGIKHNPWEGMVMENATASEIKDGSTEVLNVVTLTQSYKISENVAVEVGYEKGVDFINENDQLVDVPTGNEQSNDYSVYRGGFKFDSDYVGGNVSSEYRDSETEQKTNLMSKLFSQQSEDFAYGLSSIYSTVKGKDVNDTDLALALSVVYRPEVTNLILLEKIEIVNQEKIDVKANKLINNLAFNYLYDDKLEASFQYGVKIAENKIEEYEYAGVTQFTGVDFDYYMEDGWVFGNQVSGLYAHSANNYEYSYGAYIGHNIYKNTLIKLGYNVEGFNDNDFSLQNYYYKGPYLQFKTKFNQNNIKDVIRDIL